KATFDTKIHVGISKLIRKTWFYYNQLKPRKGNFTTTD
ncbi:MAG: hypothetical protein ACI9XU_000745, partial [Arenicella sp.]